MRQAVELVGVVNLVLFAAVAAVCARQWRRERAVTAMWAALAFLALAWVVVAGRVLPDDAGSLASRAVERLDLAILVLFPYLLYRFAVAFERTRRPFAQLVDTLSTILVATTIALPRLPEEGQTWPWWFAAYAVAFVVHWSVLLLIVAARLWRAGRGEASVARRRMRLLAFASTSLTVALVLALASPDDDEPLALAIGVIASISGIAFLLGFAPPAALRALWRRPEQERMQRAIADLMTATTEADVAAHVLAPMAHMVGASGVALERTGGERVGTYGSVDDAEAGDVTHLPFPFGRIVVRTSTFAPFFGDEERRLLTALGSLSGLALDRARLFAQERGAREALERTDELKSQFVALAAHELRTPVGAIYGISETLAARGPFLAAGQVAELQTTLTQQIRRLRELVEQLLDLSRLEAQAVTIKPQRVQVRERLERIVTAVAPLDAARIAIEVDDALEAEVDVDALERIVSNLLLNACRYGEPPIVVRAEEAGGVLHVTVEDSGPGVPAEFVPQLFDRFARSGESAAAVAGSGLGLAIARSYARAHSGEVSYRPARPHGAAFEVVLPGLHAV